MDCLAISMCWRGSAVWFGNDVLTPILDTIFVFFKYSHCLSPSTWSAPSDLVHFQTHARDRVTAPHDPSFRDVTGSYISDTDLSTVNLLVFLAFNCMLLIFNLVLPVVLYGCEALREEHRLRVFENRSWDPRWWVWRKLHNEIHSLYQ